MSEERKKNIHGHCPHCGADLDGDLVINHPLSEGKSRKEAIEYAKHYAGWEQHGELNRWGRALAHSDMGLDMVTKYECPDCHGQWPRSVMVDSAPPTVNRRST